jgi:predicted transcriptional regulator
MAGTQGIKLDDSIRSRLIALGKLKQRTPHWLMRQAIERFLDEEERYECERQEDLERWERYQVTGRAVSHSKAANWLSELAEGRTATCPK